MAPDVHFFTRDGRAAVVQIVAGKEGGDTALAVVPLDGGSVKRIAIDSSLWEFMDVIRANARTVWQLDGQSLSLRLRDVKSGEVAVVQFDIATGAQEQLWKGRAELRGLNAAQDATDLFGLYETSLKSRTSIASRQTSYVAPGCRVRRWTGGDVWFVARSI